MVEYARTLNKYTRCSYQGLETPERQPKPQPLHLSRFCLSRYHARLKESSRHNYMQDAWESENYLVLFRQNAQTPPSVALLHLIMAQIFPYHHHDQIAQPALSQACRPRPMLWSIQDRS